MEAWFIKISFIFWSINYFFWPLFSVVTSLANPPIVWRDLNFSFKPDDSIKMPAFFELNCWLKRLNVLLLFYDFYSKPFCIKDLYNIKSTFIYLALLSQTSLLLTSLHPFLLLFNSKKKPSFTLEGSLIKEIQVNKQKMDYSNRPLWENYHF